MIFEVALSFGSRFVKDYRLTSPMPIRKAVNLFGDSCQNIARGALVLALRLECTLCESVLRTFVCNLVELEVNMSVARSS